MILSTFTEKLNKIENSVHTVEEEVTMPSSGTYEEELAHDNVDEGTLEVYTGSKKTGDSVGYTLRTPSDMPWKRIIKIESSAEKVYISYECSGDQVEGDDINRLQEELIRTQRALNDIQQLVTGSISGFTWNQIMGIKTEDIINITTQPTSISVAAGSEATFKIVATGTSLTYQWQYVETDGGSWTNFANGNEATLTITPTITWSGRQIRCIVKSSTGAAAISETAILTVTEPETAAEGSEA